MKHVTKLNIKLRLHDKADIADVVSELPDYCSSTFIRGKGDLWFGEFIISCKVAPKLADGDFVDDFSPYFPALLRLKQFNEASFSLQIAVGSPAEEFFTLESYSVALLAGLGTSITIINNTKQNHKCCPQKLRGS
jgi:hypothetical protein